MNTTQFLELFPGRVCYATLDDKRKDSGLNHYHEGFDLTREQILAALQTENASGRGVYFCVNEINPALDPQKTRTSKMFCGVRAIWADMDTPTDAPLTGWPLPPSLVVNTSPGKYHYYWLTRPPIDQLPVWRQVMNGLAVRFGSDANARDLVRILRLPGFYHHKAEPFLSTVVDASSTVYDWDAIVAAFPPDTSTPVPKTREGAGTSTQIKVTSYDQAAEYIRTGAVFHDSVMWLLNHWANKGISAGELKLLIKNQLAQSVIQDERWEARNEDHYLDANIRDAIQFVKANPIVQPVAIPHPAEEVEFQYPFEFPPGLAGKAVQDILDMAIYPNPEIALVALLGLCSGIMGRTYNIGGTGVNLYITLLARTGLGKSHIKDTIHKVLIGPLGTDTKVGATFLGHSEFTSGKALVNQFETGASKVSIIEEAGEMGKATLGNQPSLRKAQLDLKTSSGVGKRFDSSAYSDVKNNTKILFAPAWTQVRVSTPKSYTKSQRDLDAANTGELARFLTIETRRDKPYPNLTPSSDFSPEVLQALRELLITCGVNQSDVYSDPKHVVQMQSNLLDIEAETRYWVDMENRLAFVDPIKSSIASRQEFKIRNIAALFSVFNNRETEEIHPEIYAWAKRLCLKEFETIGIIMEDGDVKDIASCWDQVIAPFIIQIINYKYEDAKKRPAEIYKGRGVFTLGNLTACVKKNERVKGFDTLNKTGIQRFIDYGLYNGLLLRVDEKTREMLGGTKRDANLFRITDEFTDRFNDKSGNVVTRKKK